MPAPAAAEAPPSDPLDVRSGQGGPGDGEPRETASQAVQDFILMQIARHWIIDFQAGRFRDLRLTLRFVLLPNGELAPPFGRRDPWNLPVLVNNFARLSEAERTAAITFLQAMRQAQPFRLPPGGESLHTRALPLDFRLGDIHRP